VRALHGRPSRAPFLAGPARANRTPLRWAFLCAVDRRLAGIRDERGGSCVVIPVFIQALPMIGFA